ncbi:MAG: 3-deoxy-D-manno-octulosonic acid transferase [Rhodobacteraceae bacterium]|nr:3-deoxy-D-manno-octulosonic acid transferase [Paracoccaceae bacterium]
MGGRFPSPRLRMALVLYRALWWLGLPAVLVYLWRRTRRDPDYGRHLRERFGLYPDWPGEAPVWIHAVSLGELRSATPLIRALLTRGERVLLTHFTPAGRRESARLFGDEIRAGQVRPVWVPLELGPAMRRFIRHFAPRYGLVMEIEVWPVMIMECRRAGLPLFMCNAQYPSKSYERDLHRTKLRAELMRGFAGALVKSELQRERFATAGVTNIAITGETRFDQPVPPAQIAAAAAARPAFGAGRRVITIASAVNGEDPLYLSAIRQTRENHARAGLPMPLFVYVPRAPERFDEVAGMIATAGLGVLRRSKVFDRDLTATGPLGDTDILLGDSLGEMYFYLALADLVIVGGGYRAAGAHNIIEPLALKKPVIVGPSTWTIEFPAVEAVAAGVCRIVPPDALADALAPDAALPDAATIDAFFDAHRGAAKRTLAAIPQLIGTCRGDQV